MTTKNITVNHDGGDAFYNICNEMHAHTHESDLVQPRDNAQERMKTTSIQIEIKKLKYYIERSELSFANPLHGTASLCPEVVVVHGERGTGKTTLCRAFARDSDAKEIFVHSWWINASGPAEFQANMEAALVDFLTPHRDDVAWTEAICRALTTLPSPWLLIVNDACAYALERLHEITPWVCAGRIVINTNERPDVIDATLRYDKIECRSMSPQQATDLLRAVSGRTYGDDNVYEEIARRLSYLPFALDIAGTYIKTQNKGHRFYEAERYLEILKNDRYQLLTSIVQQGDPLRNSVYKVISESIRQVQTEFDSACGSRAWPVQDTLRLLSFFPPDDLPISIMPLTNTTESMGFKSTETTGPTESHNDWIRQHVAAIAGVYPCSTWSVTAWDSLITTLHNFHLLDISVCGSTITYSMQPLLLGWARDTMHDQHESFNQWKITAMAMLASARLYKTRTPSESTVLLAKLFPHWQFCQLSSFGQPIAHNYNVNEVADLNIICTGNSITTKACQNLLFENHEFFKARGNPEHVLGSCKSLLMTRFLQSDTEAIIESRIQLAECLEMLGNHDAALNQRLVVLQNTKEYGRDAAHVHALLDVAKSFTKLGKYEEAYTRLKAALSDAKTLIWANDDDRLILIHKRFAIACQRTGRPKAASSNREALLEALRVNGYPEDHAEVLDAKLNLANSYIASHVTQKEKALKLQQEVLESETTSLPEDHPRVLLAKSSLAWTLVHMNTTSSLRKARGILVSILQIRREHLGPFHVRTLKTRIKLSICDIRAGDADRYEHALSELRQCIQDTSQKSERHEDIRLWAMNEYADAYIRHEEPKRRRHKVLAIRVAVYETAHKRFGLDNTRMIIPTINIAEALEGLYFWHAALPFRARVLHLTGALLEDCEVQKLKAKCRLAVNLGHSSHVEEQEYAGTLFQEALTDAKAHRDLDSVIDRTLSFCVIPYLEYLRSRQQFSVAINLIDSFLNDSDCSTMFLPEDIEGLEALRVRCRDEICDNWEPPIRYHDRPGTKLCTVNAEEDCPVFLFQNIPILNENLIRWEEGARLQPQRNAVRSLLPPIPSPLPWQSGSGITWTGPVDLSRFWSTIFEYCRFKGSRTALNIHDDGKATLRVMLRLLNTLLLRKRTFIAIALAFFLVIGSSSSNSSTTLYMDFTMVEAVLHGLIMGAWSRPSSRVTSA
ncbi:hypothetical protein T440DRAFT_474652 [Plenodomus tracheiphilus IPT5]|uniref:Orc1-like AAA ATPase domain-containing protein n=1 Tax=Plenodomus tracheiphilus IPT5 TaxID=1408161 RepID=A0A6A7BLC1_9PLEO|nr:hypothetical protein T440DRAFT_474652 [Plenodomus tracheiphilus IPT5]